MAEDFSGVDKCYESSDSGSPTTHEQIKQREIHIQTFYSKIAEHQRQRRLKQPERNERLSTKEQQLDRCLSDGAQRMVEVALSAERM